MHFTIERFGDTYVTGMIARAGKRLGMNVSGTSRWNVAKSLMTSLATNHVHFYAKMNVICRQ